MKLWQPAVTAFAVLVFVNSCPSVAQSQAISRLVTFGDSHSDVGNGGRFSDATNWIDALALELDVPFTEPSRRGGSNYAVGGARTGLGFDGGGSIPRLGTQIESFLSDHSPSDDQLTTILIGHNDFGWGAAQSIDRPLEQLSTHINSLINTGVHTLLVANVPPLAELPAYRGTARAASLDRLIPEFNDGLSRMLDNVVMSRNVDIFRVDFYGMVTEMISKPADFALTNTTARANSIPRSNPDEYLYWDDHHYTSATYSELGRRAAAAIPSYFKAMSAPLIESGEEWSYFVGTEEPSRFPDLAWTMSDFEDESWQTGAEGFGYGGTRDVEHVQTTLADMKGKYTTAYIRHPFSVENPDSLRSIRLLLDYDDMFIAYVNGVEVARSDSTTLGVPSAFDATASSSHESRFREVIEIDLAAFPELLRPNDMNILAIQGINRRLSDSDFVLAQLRLDGILVRGDFNDNALLDVGDIETLTVEMRTGRHDVAFDLNEDGLVDSTDRQVWVNKLKKTYFGDANLDGEFNSSDLVALFSAGEYEDDIAMNSTWATGDFDGDGDFGSGDLVAAFTDGGYEQGPRVEANAVPEPASSAMLLSVLIGIAFVSRTRRKSV